MFPHESLLLHAQEKLKQQGDPKNVLWRITQDQLVSNLKTPLASKKAWLDFHPCFQNMTGRINELLRRYQGEMKILRTETNFCCLLKPACGSRKTCDFFHSFGSFYFGIFGILQGISRAAEKIFFKKKKILKKKKKIFFKNKTSVIIIWTPIVLGQQNDVSCYISSAKKTPAEAAALLLCRLHHQCYPVYLSDPVGKRQVPHAPVPL